ncbi:NAD(P)/FAD-dependent oxidoreductase [Agrococcus sp. HG114]|uniref:NAD(P)/FAD-dependent oxidoreductase n=1 Tax=Agrococcus sp. HG114 TaxID=2969757 RepID=UPI00215B441D|nr:FAD-dependent oxidoreductase [Agrococcus sp. HG114]MCR8671514.1 FAD-dependent oxidoreductase [Agrococcus sp. HG114]
MSIAIVGAGLAGATAATELRKQGYREPITLIGGEAHLPYERPPLSKGYLMGRQPFEKALVHDRGWYDEHGIELMLGTRATAIDLERRTVQTEPAAGDGESRAVRFDQLLLATGATPRRLDLGDGVGPMVTLRTVDDSDALRAAFRPGARMAIVGAGWIGLEAASAARQSEVEVTVFETAELPLLRVLGPELAQVVAELHRGHGVDLRLGTRVAPADLVGADLVLAAVGVTPAIELAEAAGLATDDGVLVDARLRASDPRVYAVGDIAAHDHPVLGRRIRVEHWDTAIRQARTAARNLLGAEEPYTRLPYFFTDQYDMGMEYVGSVGPDGYDRVDIEGSTDVLAGHAFRAFWVKDGTVAAAMHVNDWDASRVIRESVGAAR